MTPKAIKDELLSIIEPAIKSGARYYGGREPVLPMFKNRDIRNETDSLAFDVNEYSVRITVDVKPKKDAAS